MYIPLGVTLLVQQVVNRPAFFKNEVYWDCSSFNQLLWRKGGADMELMEMKKSRKYLWPLGGMYYTYVSQSELDISSYIKLQDLDL